MGENHNNKNLRMILILNKVEFFFDSLAGFSDVSHLQ